MRLFSPPQCIYVVALACCLGCVAEPPSAPSGNARFLSSSMPLCTRAGPQANFFAPRVACGAQIRVGPAPGSEAYAAEIAEAADAWNNALVDSRAPGIPSFVPGTGYDLQVVVTGGGPWCGSGSYNTTPWVITLANSCPGGGNHSDVRTTLIHELSHALGMLDNAERLGQPGVSDGCTSNLNQDGTINALVCQHDVEMVYAAYGMRDGQGLPIDFWLQPIVTGLDVTPSSLTLQPTQQAQVSVTCLRFDRAGGVQAGGGQLAPPAENCSLDGLGFSWTIDNRQVADIPFSNTAVGVVTGVGTGSTTVRVGLTTPPSGGQLGAVFARMGSEVSVTVPGEPPGPFRVTAITGVPVPITSSGTYATWAAVANQPPGTLQVAFNITYSNGVFQPIFTGFSASPYQLVVPGGSYNIHIEAIPAVGGQTGLGLTTDIPVCTDGGGGGGGQLVARLEPPTPDAKGGC